ncbi:MAG: hypothetical protein A3C43_04275 [Candidatus Schekmanbacteria bacterium RIFCSPHIGHO2_02_FULL_38_11]|nr:MAG: hypothetical protein A3C43_04275 [Candidatus Schekmanbacteria bacterium RIFCSPHIGHO2_02_FULL_38_11]
MKDKELSPENQLILNCATTAMDENVCASNLDMIKKGLNWEHIYETAKNHNVAPLMYPNLKELNNNHPIPQNILFKFRKSYHSNGIRNTRLYNELAILLKEFKENGIEVMFIKGAALAILVYKNIALRPMSDVDILIKKEDAEKVEEILVKNGYKEDIPLRRKYFSELFPYLSPYVKTNILTVEIKWGLFGYWPNGFKPGFNDFSKSSKFIIINNLTVLIPSIENMVELVWRHAKKHKIVGEQQLLSYCDLAELERSYGKEIKHKFKYILTPEEILEDEKNNSKDLYFIPGVYDRIKSINGIYNKLLYIFGSLFPNREFIIKHYKIRNKKSVYLYFLLRPSILILNMLKSLLFKIKKSLF